MLSKEFHGNNSDIIIRAEDFSDNNIAVIVTIMIVQSA